MATIINTPASTGESSSGMGFLLGIVFLILFILALLYVGLPMLNRATSSPQVNVPDQIDVNINQPSE